MVDGICIKHADSESIRTKPVKLIAMLCFCPPLWVGKITSGINMAWIFKSLCHLYSTLNYCHLSDTTSVYLQRRDASFVADLNMEKRKDYAGPKGTDCTGAEYCKKCFINSTDTMKEISFSTEKSAMKRKHMEKV